MVLFYAHVPTVAGSKYCVPLDVGGYAGVSMSSMLREGNEYLRSTHPLLDYVASVELLGSEPTCKSAAE